jgi:hypothetical protein
MGCPRRERECGMRNDGPGWSRRDDADESWFLARFGLFPNHDRPHFMPCVLRDATRWSRWTDIMSTVFINKRGVGQQDPKDGIMWAFIAMIPFMWLCVLLTTFLGNVWILKDGGHEVVNGAYLWSFATRKKLTRERISRGDGLGNLAPMGAEKKDGNDVEAGLRHPANTPSNNDGAQNIEAALATGA